MGIRISQSFLDFFMGIRISECFLDFFMGIRISECFLGFFMGIRNSECFFSTSLLKSEFLSVFWTSFTGIGISERFPSKFSWKSDQKFRAFSGVL